MSMLNDFESTRVVAAWDETPFLRGIRVDLGERRASHTKPGQVVRLRSGGHGDSYFALASAPTGDGRADLLVKRGAALADAIISAAQPDARLEMTSVFGRGFPVEPAHGHDVLLFAAGSGISPIRSLVQHVIAHRAEFGKAALFYGQRAHEDFAYQREHAAWHESGVQVVLCSSQLPDGANGTPPALLKSGYVQDVAHSLGFLDADPGRSVAYLCGMKNMVASVKEVLARAQVASERIFLNF
jgi:NAD(P)H-flavin reductase